MCCVSRKVQAKYLFLLKYNSPFSDKLKSELTNINMLGNFLLDVLNFMFINTQI